VGGKKKETGSLREIRRFPPGHRTAAPQCRQPPADESEQPQPLVVPNI
jgi:hypothetical protein